jgi:hypothetical protein
MEVQKATNESYINYWFRQNSKLIIIGALVFLSLFTIIYSLKK